MQRVWSLHKVRLLRSDVLLRVLRRGRQRGRIRAMGEGRCRLGCVFFGEDLFCAVDVVGEKQTNHPKQQEEQTHHKQQPRERSRARRRNG